MKIPKDARERELFYQELTDKCMYSVEERARVYGQLRAYYLFGTDNDDSDNPFNKIDPHIDLMTSFLFSADTTKFALSFPPDVPKTAYSMVSSAQEAVNHEWNSSGTDLIMMNAIEWALVYNTTFIKLIWRGGKTGSIHPFMVEPQCVGVYREDVPMTDRQEAICHKFYMTRSELNAALADHPQKGRLLKKAIAKPAEQTYVMSGLDRVILISTQPALTGNVITPLAPREQYIARLNEELVEMYELWIWDDDIDDYQVVTRTDDRLTIYDRPNFFVKHEHPFIQCCPYPMSNYYWGRSMVNGLIGLQKWRNERVAQIRHLGTLQAEPPTSIVGAMSIPEELNFALNRPGGVLGLQDITAKVDRYDPKIPDDMFKEVSEIDEMFEEKTGMQGILMGKGERGVRSGRQTTELARLGSARIKKRALVIEDVLEKVATLTLKCMARQLDTAYPSEGDKDGEKPTFILKQLPDKFTVKVDGHSNSPLFVEDNKALAEDLLEKGIIDKRTYVEMVDPPGRDMILARLPALEAKQAAEKKAAEEAKIRDDAAKHGKASGNVMPMHK